MTSLELPRIPTVLATKNVEQIIAGIHPGLLLRHVVCVDNTTGDSFRFHFSRSQLIKWATTPNSVANSSIPLGLAERLFANEPEHTDWEFQGDLIDWWLDSDITVILKARQLGITWCAAGVALWYGLYRPGNRVLIQSKNEDDAADLIDHIWEMFLSLGPRELEDGTEVDLTHLRNHVVQEKPKRPGVRPYLDIEWIHPLTQRVSQINAMASTAGAGHGRTAAFVILDEFSRHPYAREAYKAIVPAQGGSKKVKGKSAIISTANGVSSDEESGNFYHHLWTNSPVYGIRTLFLPWNANPDRDDQWYADVAMKLPPKDRGEQYPMTPDEAFILTGDQYFDVEALRWYGENAIAPILFKGEWEAQEPGIGKMRKGEFGSLAVYKRPRKGHKYAMGCDVATGKGKDFSCFYVIDLSNMSLVAEFHAKIDADRYAEQIHYTGKWYNSARVAVEQQGGYGDAVIIPLRDGRDGRPPYEMLYRHRQESSVDRKMHKPYGFPMNTKTRPLVISQLEQAIRDHDLPWMTHALLSECRTFTHQSTNPSPRASDGSNDDRVMAAAVTLELYRQYGVHVNRYRPDLHTPEEEKTVPNSLKARLKNRYLAEVTT